MEPETEFDLEPAIQSWRSRFTGSAIDQESLQELETHLRDSLASIQEGSGVSKEDAFAIACYRLGEARALDAEFANLEPKRIWRQRLLWMLLGAQLVQLTGSVSDALYSLGTIGWPLLRGSIRGVALHLMAYGGFSALLLYGHLWKHGRVYTGFASAIRQQPGRWCAGLALLLFGSTATPYLAAVSGSLGELVAGIWSRVAWGVPHDGTIMLPSIVVGLLAVGARVAPLPILTYLLLRKGDERWANAARG